MRHMGLAAAVDGVSPLRGKPHEPRLPIGLPLPHLLNAPRQTAERQTGVGQFSLLITKSTYAWSAVAMSPPGA